MANFNHRPNAIWIRLRRRTLRVGVETEEKEEEG